MPWAVPSWLPIHLHEAWDPTDHTSGLARGLSILEVARSLLLFVITYPKLLKVPERWRWLMCRNTYFLCFQHLSKNDVLWPFPSCLPLWCPHVLILISANIAGAEVEPDSTHQSKSWSESAKLTLTPLSLAISEQKPGLFCFVLPPWLSHRRGCVWVKEQQLLGLENWRDTRRKEPTLVLSHVLWRWGALEMVRGVF